MLAIDGERCPAYSFTCRSTYFLPRHLMGILSVQLVLVTAEYSITLLQLRNLKQVILLICRGYRNSRVLLRVYILLSVWVLVHY